MDFHAKCGLCSSRNERVMLNLVFGAIPLHSIPPVTNLHTELHDSRQLIISSPLAEMQSPGEPCGRNEIHRQALRLKSNCPAIPAAKTQSPGEPCISGNPSFSRSSRCTRGRISSSSSNSRSNKYLNLLGTGPVE